LRLVHSPTPLHLFLRGHTINKEGIINFIILSLQNLYQDICLVGFRSYRLKALGNFLMKSKQKIREHLIDSIKESETSVVLTCESTTEGK